MIATYTKRTLILISIVTSSQAMLTIENQTDTSIRITGITLWQSQGVEKTPTPYNKEIFVQPKQTLRQEDLVDDQNAIIIALTLIINGMPHQFSLPHNAHQASSIHITPTFSIELFGEVQRVRPHPTVRFALPASLYAV